MAVAHVPLASPCDIVLGGGGIKGYGHLGFLQAMEELHIKPKHLFGISIGSLVAAFYANGYPTKEIAKIFRKEISEFYGQSVSQLYRWQSIRVLLSRWGIVDLQPLFTSMVEQYKLKPLPSFSIVAYNLASRTPIRFTGCNYDLGAAITASCAALVFMQSVQYKDANQEAEMRLVDGGVYHTNTTLFCDGPAIVSRLGSASRLPGARLPLLDFFIHLGEMVVAPTISAFKKDIPKDHLVIRSGKPDVATMTFGVSEQTCQAMVEYGYRSARKNLAAAIASGRLIV